MNIWHLSDGKAGHVAQARGLFVALERAGQTVHVLDIQSKDLSRLALFFYGISGGRVGQLPQILADALQQQGAPDLIVGIGHATHLVLILLRRCFPASKSVVLMRPSLPLAWFDYALMPAHDFSVPTPPMPSKVFISQGVLNPLQNEHRHVPGQHLILLGGASKRFDWSDVLMLDQLQSLLQRLLADAEVTSIWLTTSRRTPSHFIETLRGALGAERVSRIHLCPVDETPRGWLFEQLQLADVVWVTQDSGSMLFEALTAGCRVGVLAMQQIKTDTVTQATDVLLSMRRFLPVSAYFAGETFAPVEPVAEADRAAVWLLTRLHEDHM